MNTTRKKRLGIISGAGPMAGALFLKKIIKAYQAIGAWKDEDFPLMYLINYPFSDMLNNGYEYNLIQKELLSCIDELQFKCDYIVITCQTLHLFLSENY